MSPLIARQLSPLDKYAQNGAYSYLRHLAKTLLLSGWIGSTWVFMTTLPETSAYFDESRMQSNFPIVAGFWNSIDLWMVCEEHLQRALRDKPEGLEAKKYVRDNSLHFAKILSAFTLLPVFATIERDVWGKRLWDVKGAGNPAFANAYASCCYSCCVMLDLRGKEKGWRKPLPVVFDDGAEGKHYWERGYRKYIKENPSSVLDETPHFAKDEIAKPLLAADLYAWLLSRDYNEGLTGEEREALALLHQRQPLSMVLDQKALDKIVQERQRHV